MATAKVSKLISYMVVGKTGVGKTSLINSVAGSEIAEEGNDLDIGTFNIESYVINHESSGTTVTIRFWDTPGLFDMSKKSDSYMEQIRGKYEECDLVLYCSDLTDTRITEQDKRVIHAFTQSLGASFWQHSCFMLTFANCVEDPRSRRTTAAFFASKVKSFKDAYCKVLKEASVSAKIVDNIPFIPVGYHPWSVDKEMYVLPDGKNWISTFWMSCFARVKDNQQLPRTLPPKRQSPPDSQPQARPTRDQCTFNRHQRDYIKQDWFECHTCWGGDSAFGCCWPCALDCHRGHQIVRHHPPNHDGSSAFFCDCGLNKHQPAVCTFHSTNTEMKPQPFYKCFSCFTISEAGVCHQCMINCHRGHRIHYGGVRLAFCDCGLPYCKVNCRIAKPK